MTTLKRGDAVTLYVRTVKGHVCYGPVMIVVGFGKDKDLQYAECIYYKPENGWSAQGRFGVDLLALVE